MAKYADIKVTEVDKMMSAENLTDEQKSRIRQSMTRVYGEPKVQVKSKSPFD
jgi:F0F1-type ATP synthase delta subunit